MFKIVAIIGLTIIVSAYSDDHHGATSYANVNSKFVPVAGGHDGGSGGHGDGKKEHYANHHPLYNFEYGVKDGKTGDVKSQHESRDGDKVDGGYKIVQPDGVTRNVKYHADKHGGFNADVSYSGHSVHPHVVSSHHGDKH